MQTYIYILWLRMPIWENAHTNVKNSFYLLNKMNMAIYWKTYHCQSNASVSWCWLNNCTAWCQPTLLFSIFNHSKSNAIFHRSAWIEELYLCIYKWKNREMNLQVTNFSLVTISLKLTDVTFQTRFFGNFVEFNQRRRTNSVQNIWEHSLLISTINQLKEIELDILNYNY